jgi:large subunit ribosomal protein L17
MKSMIVHGNIKTTRAKAQAVRSELEKLITKAKKGTEAMKRDILSRLNDRKITNQLMEMAKTQFGNRNSGYTRMVKIGPRQGDATEMVVLSFVDEKVVTEVLEPKKPEAGKTKSKKP